jgi:hypothetical protein
MREMGFGDAGQPYGNIPKPFNVFVHLDFGRASVSGARRNPTLIWVEGVGSCESDDRVGRRFSPE